MLPTKSTPGSWESSCRVAASVGVTKDLKSASEDVATLARKASSSLHCPRAKKVLLLDSWSSEFHSFPEKIVETASNFFLHFSWKQWHFQKPDTVHSDQLKKLSKHDWAGWENLRLIRFARHVDWHVGWQQPVVQRGISGLWYEWLAYKKMAES